MNRSRVLVVDDSALMRAVITRTLAGEGYDLREAADGDVALATCAEEVPDVIVLDVEMPGLDGHETLARLRAHPGLDDVPVLFLTGRTDPVDVAEGLRLGAHDYLRKPFEAIELVARVRAAMRVRELHMALRARNAELERIARTDALTGLFNRRFVEEQAARATSRMARHGGALTVVLLDLDGFKAVNDGHGHVTGDELLVEVGQRLVAMMRLEDVVARWGGEEFLVLAADTDVAGAAELAERLRAGLASEPVVVGERSFALTLSAGWAVGRGGTTFSALVQGADQALYAAKAAGRNRVCGPEAAPG